MLNDSIETTEDEAPSFWTRLADNIKVRMLAGLLLMVPLVVTILVLQFLFGMFESLVAPIVELSKSAEVPKYLTIAISVVAFICLIYLTGLLSAHVFGKRLMTLAEKAVLRIPVVKSVYSATKQAVDLLSHSNRTAFKSVVLVEFPCKGSKSIAFLIGNITDQYGNTRVKVLVPTCPSPLTAFLLLLLPEQVEKTDISVEEGIKMVVSGGIVSPDKITITPSV